MSNKFEREGGNGVLVLVESLAKIIPAHNEIALSKRKEAGFSKEYPFLRLISVDELGGGTVQVVIGNETMIYSFCISEEDQQKQVSLQEITVPFVRTIPEPLRFGQ